jgi:hypothetical protein
MFITSGLVNIPKGFSGQIFDFKIVEISFLIRRFNAVSPSKILSCAGIKEHQDRKKAR